MTRALHFATVTALLAGGAAWLAAIAGCESGAPTENQRFAERRHALRLERMERTAGAAAQAEESRPERLGRTFDAIERRLVLDARHLESNAEGLERLIERDFRRWEANQPRYLDDLTRILWGRPQNVERNAITLFW